MSPSGNPDWVWYGAGIVLALLGLALAYWSLLHDRARGRRRCPKCWYDMSSPGPDPLTCPECGRTAKREKKLFKTRRRWGWATFACLMAVSAISLSLTPKVRRDGWQSIVPTSALIVMFPFYENGYQSGDWRQDCFQLLEERLWPEDSLADWHQRLLFWIVIPRQQQFAQQRLTQLENVHTPDHDSLWSFFESSSNITSVPYTSITGFLIPSDDRPIVLSEANWEELVQAYPLFTCIAPHQRWPEDTPVQWRLLILPIMDSYVFDTGKVTVTASLNDTSNDTAWLPHDKVDYIEWGGGLIDIAAPTAAPPPGIYDVRFEIKVFSLKPYNSELGFIDDSLENEESWQFYTTRTLTTRLVVGGTIDDILIPDRSESSRDQLSKAIRGVSFEHCWNKWSDDTEGKFRISFEEYAMKEIMDRLTFSPRLQLLRQDDEPIDLKGEILMWGNHNGAPPSVSVAFFLPKSPDSPWRSAQPGERWTMRLYGSGEDALREIDSGAYWAGSFEIDVDLHALMNCESFETARFKD